jgi:sodium/bile acid cotransporter 7
LRIGFLFLSVLPTTISSAVVLTSLARGNAAGALVNTTLSNLVGVVITPLWLGLLLQAKGNAPAIGPLVISISLMILLPFVVGQCMRPFARGMINAHTSKLRDASSVLILFIVYAAFCDSVKSGLWSVHDLRLIAFAIVAAAVLLVGALLLTFLGARFFGLDDGDRIAAVMCAPQKTLAAGVPMAKLIFASSPALGLILLPVMLYHALQLVAGGILVNRMKLKPDEKNR